MVAFLFGFIVWVACGVFSAMVASGKGRGSCLWFILGLLFGPLALIAAIGMSKVEPSAPPAPPDRRVKCPHCKELIQPDANKCRFCQSDLSQQGGARQAAKYAAVPEVKAQVLTPQLEGTGKENPDGTKRQDILSDIATQHPPAGAGVQLFLLDMDDGSMDVVDTAGNAIGQLPFGTGVTVQKALRAGQQVSTRVLEISGKNCKLELEIKARPSASG